MVLTKGSGSFVWNMEGQKLLDFTSGIAVTSLGHCHPRIVEAVQKQAAELVHGQGEGGYVAPPPGFLQGLSSLCYEHDILLIADEVRCTRVIRGYILSRMLCNILLQVQCGFGRTGSMFAIDGQYDVVPDILVMAKGIANGYPLSAIASRNELTDLQ
ncbi:hypothetical protein DYB28_001737, partial [Aphanomyces astaci]